MEKVLTTNKAITLSEKLRKDNKSIVLAGGCFDILHIGHIYFLEAAKKLGDILIIMLESNKTVQQLKGKQRPINTQKNRAQILASLIPVDYIILLPHIANNETYDQLVEKIKPAIIATTQGDPCKTHKNRQARKTNAKVIEIKKIPNTSTTKFADILSQRGLL